METFNINIQGYWREINKAGIPAHSGVYFVYKTKFNPNTSTVTLKEVLYVGETDNVKTRIAEHELFNEWKNHLEPGYELSFSTGSVPLPVRARITAAFIFDLKPITNSKYKNEFPFEGTTIIVTGMTSCLKTNFTVG